MLLLPLQRTNVTFAHSEQLPCCFHLSVLHNDTIALPFPFAGKKIKAKLLFFSFTFRSLLFFVLFFAFLFSFLSSSLSIFPLSLGCVGRAQRSSWPSALSFSFLPFLIPLSFSPLFLTPSTRT